MAKDLFNNPIDDPITSGQTTDPAEKRLVRVAFENAGDLLFDYALPEHLEEQCRIGQRIIAPLGRGNKMRTGFCVDFPERTDSRKVKYIVKVLDETPLLDAAMIELARWISHYYCCGLGVTLAAMVPMAVKKNIGAVKKTYVRLTDAGRNAIQTGMEHHRMSSKGRAVLEHLYRHYSQPGDSCLIDEVSAEVGTTRAPFQTLAKAGYLEIYRQNDLLKPDFTPAGTFLGNASQFELNENQKKAVDTICGHIDQGGFSTTLLYGVTGSGKTEVYMSCIEHVVSQGQQAIVLVPEIALTPQTETRFIERFGRVAVLHSGMSNSQRHMQWRWIADGLVNVVVGARSAVFAPLQNPGLIVVDEEHEPSYKQDKAPRYHGRNVAIKRAQIHNIPVVLGSATPSLETIYNSQNRPDYTVVQLPHRVKNLPMPRVIRVNMRQEMKQQKKPVLISTTLDQQLRQCVDQHHQAIIFLNRRGHSNFIYCPSCQYIHTCPNCDVSLTYHRHIDDFDYDVHRMMVCHYCMHSSRVPRSCPLCKGKLILLGAGTQKAEDELNERYPHMRIRRVDSDSVSPADYAELLRQFGRGEIDVLLGTQMIGKGLDFPNVALVGVLSADMALSLPDFRSAERTFQLIAQVAGRCGRSIDNGIVVVQSYLPDEPSITMACRHEFSRFAAMELQSRKRCKMPPCYRLARIIMRFHKLEPLQDYARQLRELLDHHVKALDLDVQVRGPVPAAIARIENYHRYEILLKGPTAAALQQLLGAVRSAILSENKIQAVVDVDPIHLM